MRGDLVKLIEEIPEIKKFFHTSTEEMISFNAIYNVQDFINWKEEVRRELLNICERNGDPYISEAVKLFNTHMTGYNDEETFQRMGGVLNVIGKHINEYYSECSALEGSMKPPKIFISHSKEDYKFASEIVNLLKCIGLDEKEIFCSSLPRYDIHIDENIKEEIKRQFYHYDLHVIILHSKNFYSSSYCLNEMGAAWIFNLKVTSILLP